MTFDRFFDDAAIFPPGNAPIDVALKAHLARRASADGRYVGPFVCDAACLPELRALLTAPLEVAVVSGTLERWGRTDHLPDEATVVERPWGTGFTVPDGAVLKLRCGGASVPSVEDVASALVHCVEHDQPFKLTAGLHAAIAHDGAHGFVNVMAAVVAAARGDDPAPLLTAGADDLDLAGLAESRRWFRSIGTCSIDEPLADLRALGLIA